MCDADCIFCRIVAGEAPAAILCADDRAIAFMDIHPVAPGHILVASRGHARNIFDIAGEDLAAVIAMAQRVAGALDRALHPDGISLVQGNGAGAAQSVPHFHLHVLPRSVYDDLPLNWRLTPGDPRAIQAIAEQIREQLAR